jgi:hypothetical protein
MQADLRISSDGVECAINCLCPRRQDCRRISPPARPFNVCHPLARCESTQFRIQRTPIVGLEREIVMEIVLRVWGTVACRLGPGEHCAEVLGSGAVLDSITGGLWRGLALQTASVSCCM